VAVDSHLAESRERLSGLLTDRRPLRETLVEIAEFAVKAPPMPTAPERLRAQPAPPTVS
jgi:hypothetical protein